MNSSISSFFKKYSYKIELVIYNASMIKELNKHFILENEPIFEHNSYHIFSYLMFQKQVYVCTSAHAKFLVVFDKHSFYIFAPIIKDIEKFRAFIVDITTYINSFNGIKILSKAEVDLIFGDNKFLCQLFKIIVHSEGEAVYDVDLLTTLPGKHFAKLRNTKNKLQKGIIKFNTISINNIEDVKLLLKKWQQVQGIKYLKFKLPNELYLVKKFFQIAGVKKDIVFKVGYYNDIPVATYVFFKHPFIKNWGIIYLVKGLSRTADGGIHSASDIAYLNVFTEASSMGIRYLNDGELGTEEGTRSHKLSFLPVKFIQSFDIVKKI